MPNSLEVANMAGCILLGKHAITIEHDDEADYGNMIVKTGDVEIGFYLDKFGNLDVTFSSVNTTGADLLRVLPPPIG